MNTFNNFIPNKTSTFDYDKTVWLNKEIVSYLKKISKLARTYFNNPTDQKKNLPVDTITLNAPDSRLLQQQKKVLTRLSTQLEDSKT